MVRVPRIHSWLCYTASQCVTLCVTLRHIASHCITLHHTVTLHFIAELAQQLAARDQELLKVQCEVESAHASAAGEWSLSHIVTLVWNLDHLIHVCSDGILCIRKFLYWKY